MGTRATKKIPEYVYFVGTSGWIDGPYVHPQKGRINRKFLVTEVPMDEPKIKNTEKK
jgi:hypothetical protein